MPEPVAVPPPPPRGSVACRHNHVQYRHVAEPCDGHGAHYVFTCPMRYGGDTCGEVTTVPPRDGNCDPGEDRDPG